MCLEVVWSVSGGCLEGVWRVSGGLVYGWYGSVLVGMGRYGVGMGYGKSIVLGRYERHGVGMRVGKWYRTSGTPGPP